MSKPVFSQTFSFYCVHFYLSWQQKQHAYNDLDNLQLTAWSIKVGL